MRIIPNYIRQLTRLLEQQYGKESGLYYYYNPEQVQYMTQEPNGKEGWNLYLYLLNPLSKIDSLGLMAFGGEFDNRATAAIDAANGPKYSPLLFSLSLDIGTSAYDITGGNFAARIITGNSNKGLDLCAYAMACQDVGIGAAGGISVSGTVTNAPPTSGSS